MRVSGLLHVITLVACLTPLAATAQTAAQRRAAVSAAAEEQTEPYRKHRDTRHGHDHYYPDRGAIVRDLPVGTIGTSYAGVSYRYHDGIWLEPRGPAYIVVSPPIGLIAPTLPLYSTVVAHGAESFLYCNDTYYRPRPDLGGYEVVNDPAMESGSAPAPEALVGGQMPSTAGPGGTAVGGIAVSGAVGAVGAGSAGLVGASQGAGSIGGAAAVPVVAREASLSSGAMPGVGAAPGAAAVPTVVREASLSGGAVPGVGAAPGAAIVPVVVREASLSGGAMPAVGAAPGTAAAVPVVAREASLSSGTMPGVGAAPGAAAVPAVAREVSPSGGTMSGVGAAAASVPAPSLGAGAGTSAPAAPAGVGSAAAGVGATVAAVGAAPAPAVGSAPVAGAAGSPKVPKVFLYPKNGQSADQQARDRYDCYRFAVSQSGFDPMRTAGNPPAPGSEPQSDFERAQSACFEGRGYSNR